MKELDKILSDIAARIDASDNDANRERLKEYYRTSLEPLINQEVEKRIAERMLSRPEIYNFVKANIPWLIRSKRGRMQYPFSSVTAHKEIEEHLSHALFELLRSKLTQPNNSEQQMWRDIQNKDKE